MNGLDIGRRLPVIAISSQTALVRGSSVASDSARAWTVQTRSGTPAKIVAQLRRTCAVPEKLRPGWAGLVRT